MRGSCIRSTGPERFSDSEPPAPQTCRCSILEASDHSLTLSPSKNSEPLTSSPTPSTISVKRFNPGPGNRQSQGFGAFPSGDSQSHSSSGNEAGISDVSPGVPPCFSRLSPSNQDCARLPSYHVQYHSEWPRTLFILLCLSPDQDHTCCLSAIFGRSRRSSFTRLNNKGQGILHLKSCNVRVLYKSISRINEPISVSSLRPESSAPRLGTVCVPDAKSPKRGTPLYALSRQPVQGAQRRSFKTDYKASLGRNHETISAFGHPKAIPAETIEASRRHKVLWVF
ncbi:uncharacterized protein LOC134339277 [Mobula hypostoma]|uniref:uncharacterized protein LOC134339277 n=1 Tax=Mobula hypostoma TaxID=723540 RepID=UPI002FC27887